MLPALIRKELLAMSRDMHGLAAMFLLPVVFIVIMSLALKNVYEPPSRAFRYAVDNQDKGALARLLQQNWQREHGEPVALPADWHEELRRGTLKYVLVLHAGLSAELAEPSLPSGTQIELLAEPGIDINLFNSLRAELAGSAGELKARAALAQADAPKPAASASMMTIVEAKRQVGGNGPRPTSVQQNVPAWLVFGMFFVIASIAGLWVQERSSGTLARLQSLGVSRRMLLLSKALPYFGVNAIQAVLMLSVGVWLMPLLGGEGLSLQGIHFGALVLSLVAIALAAVGMALALAAAVRTHAQAAATGPLLNVLMAAIGGIMVPKFMMPEAMQRVAEWSPMNWGLEALHTVLIRGGDATATLPHVARLVAFSIAMLCVAMFFFRRRSP